MFRLLYYALLRLHPARFRRRFAQEMLSIFDHVEGGPAAAKLVADGIVSLVRQWTLRLGYWEESAIERLPWSADGGPVLYTLENFKPRASALIEGLLLTWIVCSALFLAMRHSKMHYVYLPSGGIESVPYRDVGLQKSTPNLHPIPARVPPRTQPVTERRTNSSQADRPSFGKPMSSEAKSSAGVSESQDQARLNALGKLRPTITTPPPVQSLSPPIVPTRISKETLFSYAGVYLTDTPDKLTVRITTEDGHLAIEIPGEQKSILVPIHGTRFAFAKTQDDWIEFMKRDNGAVYGLGIYRNGSQFTAHRKTN